MKKYMTAEEIFSIAEKKSSTCLGQRTAINRLFRLQDDSSKWPIDGRFSVIERAIRHARRFENQSDVMSSLEYAMFLEADESRIVNDPKNW